jgi:hypothetical protein
MSQGYNYAKKDDSHRFTQLEKLGKCMTVTKFLGGDLVQGGEGRRSFVGLEEGDELGGEAERAGEGGLGEALSDAGFFDARANNPLHD